MNIAKTASAQAPLKPPSILEGIRMRQPVKIDKYDFHAFMIPLIDGLLKYHDFRRAFATDAEEGSRFPSKRCHVAFSSRTFQEWANEALGKNPNEIYYHLTNAAYESFNFPEIVVLGSTRTPTTAQHTYCARHGLDVMTQRYDADRGIISEIREAVRTAFQAFIRRENGVLTVSSE